ncbi:MAG: hypothetical protein K9N55_08000 [Phycisphaerae bacterium]|nr:hypothetical protein [Phycisphaerae bacterium]
MKRGILIGLVLVMVVSGCRRPEFLGSQERKAPKGYVWQEFKEVHAACLKPKNWHYSDVMRENHSIFRLTRERVSANQEFLTGLTLHVFKDVPNVTNIKPSELAEKYLSEYAMSKQTVEVFVPKHSGNMIQSGGTYQGKLFVRGKSRVFKIHITALANDNTGTLYLLVYACPANQWQKFMSTIVTVGSDVMLDPTF